MKAMGICASLVLGSLFLNQSSWAADAKTQDYQIHFQQSVVAQAHPTFKALYTGQNSLKTESEIETSITSTLFGGLRLWKGAEVYLNPELSGGSGISSAFGMAGFPNGETFRVGNPKPTIYLARFFLRQNFGLGGPKEQTEDGLNQLQTQRDIHRITCTVGRFGIADLFDNNRYSHDPRTQFLNWSLMNSGAWDYPADTRGYTWGFALEYHRFWSTLRAAVVMVPNTSNGMIMDTRILDAQGFALEYEQRYELQQRKGALRALVFLNRARMGNYALAIEQAKNQVPTVDSTRMYSRSKYGFVVNWQQELVRTIGIFLRLSWNDGANETWAFAEIDQSLALGVSFAGNTWNRPNDEIGLATIINGISKQHRDYLARGGYGFMIGDGALRYGSESVSELYYRWALTSFFHATVDYQLAIHPAYNRDRGPVHIFGVRAHVEF